MPVNLRILLHWNVFLGIEVFNNQRPHEALDMKCPAEVYQSSQRVYSGLPDVDYPLTTKPSWSPDAVAFVWDAKKLTSARSSPGKPWTSKKSTTTFG
jgi:hypothetical protein